MFGTIRNGKLVWRGQEKNIIIGVFQNKNVKNTEYVMVSITVLKGKYKERIDMSFPDFQRLIELINQMPEMEVKKKRK